MLQHLVVLKDLEIFKNVSMNFHFKNAKGTRRDSVIFAKIDQIFEINFETKQVNTLYAFKQQLLCQPQFF